MHSGVYIRAPLLPFNTFSTANAKPLAMGDTDSFNEEFLTKVPKPYDLRTIK